MTEHSASCNISEKLSDVCSCGAKDSDMSNNFTAVRVETIRAGLEGMRDQFLGYSENHLTKGEIAKAATNTRFARVAAVAISDLAALETDMMKLRDNALDLSKVPSEWEFVSLDVMADTGLECTLRRSGDDLSDDVYGGGSTPAAALNAAVAKIGGGG